jgi:hypothetical protein
VAIHHQVRGLGVAEINKNYPHKLKDEEIEKYIREYAEEIFAKKGDINTVMWAAPMISLGRAEFQSRAFERSSKFSTWVSYASMGVAVIALVISIANAWSDSNWEKQQMESLAALDQRLATLDQRLIALDASTAGIASAMTSLS